MSRRSLIAFVLLVLLLLQAVRAPAARAVSDAELAGLIAGSIVVLVGSMYLGAKLAYPEQIHMLAPGAPVSSMTQRQTGGIRFGPQCLPSAPAASPDSVPLLCW